MSGIAKTPEPPYYAVIFTSERTEGNHGYEEMAEGMESVREGMGITVSYWESIEAIQKWKQNERHLLAQQRGQSGWYRKYKTRVCKVERDYGFMCDC